jgi:hypothetical protein
MPTQDGTTHWYWQFLVTWPSSFSWLPKAAAQIGHMRGIHWGICTLRWMKR